MEPNDNQNHNHQSFGFHNKPPTNNPKQNDVSPNVNIIPTDEKLGDFETNYNQNDTEMTDYHNNGVTNTTNNSNVSGVSNVINNSNINHNNINNNNSKKNNSNNINISINSKINSLHKSRTVLSNTKSNRLDRGNIVNTNLNTSSSVLFSYNHNQLISTGDDEFQNTMSGYMNTISENNIKRDRLNTQFTTVMSQFQTIMTQYRDVNRDNSQSDLINCQYLTEIHKKSLLKIQNLQNQIHLQNIEIQRLKDELSKEIENSNKNNEIEISNVLEMCSKQLNPTEFELFIGSIFESLGYDVEHCGQTHDGGIDLKINHLRNGLGCVQVKQYRMSNKVGEELIRDLWGATVGDNYNYSFMVTLGHATKHAKQWPKNKNVNLTIWEHEDLVKILSKHKNSILVRFNRILKEYYLKKIKDLNDTILNGNGNGNGNSNGCGNFGYNNRTKSESSFNSRGFRGGGRDREDGRERQRERERERNGDRDLNMSIRGSSQTKQSQNNKQRRQRLVHISGGLTAASLSSSKLMGINSINNNNSKKNSRYDVSRTESRGNNNNSSNINNSSGSIGVTTSNGANDNNDNNNNKNMNPCSSTSRMNSIHRRKCSKIKRKLNINNKNTSININSNKNNNINNSNQSIGNDGPGNSNNVNHVDPFTTPIQKHSSHHPFIKKDNEDSIMKDENITIKNNSPRNKNNNDNNLNDSGFNVLSQSFQSYMSSSSNCNSRHCENFSDGSNRVSPKLTTESIINHKIGIAKEKLKQSQLLLQQKHSHDTNVISNVNSNGNGNGNINMTDINSSSTGQCSQLSQTSKKSSKSSDLYLSSGDETSSDNDDDNDNDNGNGNENNGNIVNTHIGIGYGVQGMLSKFGLGFGIANNGTCNDNNNTTSKKRKTRRNWTTSDDEKLLNAINVYGENWTQIEENVKFDVNWNAKDCYRHYTRTLQPKLLEERQKGQRDGNLNGN